MQMESLLSRAMPASSFMRLKSLSLLCCNLDCFPQWLACSLTHLSELRLSANIFRRIPSDVAELKALQNLVLAINPGLKLALDDLETLGALPQLQSLDLARYDNEGADKTWSGRDVAVAIAIKMRFPDLACKF